VVTDVVAKAEQKIRRKATRNTIGAKMKTKRSVVNHRSEPQSSLPFQL